METQEYTYLEEGLKRGLNIFQLEVAAERLIMVHEVRKEREMREEAVTE